MSSASVSVSAFLFMLGNNNFTYETERATGKSGKRGKKQIFFRFRCSSVTEEKRQCSAQKEKSLI